VSALDLARWRFGITTVYHFSFVPLTIGLSILVTCLQTAWLVKKDPAYLRLTKFFGKIFLINFAVGVVTGIVQEFQFGMNWSAYSRFVGDVPGARLAMEALRRVLHGIGVPRTVDLRDADVRPAQRRGVVHPVAGHRDDLAG
jgi:cytochrome bd ubiquinol oxidase subunit I